MSYASCEKFKKELTSGFLYKGRATIAKILLIS
jgi:hypothetical protein